MEIEKRLKGDLGVFDVSPDTIDGNHLATAIRSLVAHSLSTDCSEAEKTFIGTQRLNHWPCKLYVGLTSAQKRYLGMKLNKILSRTSAPFQGFNLVCSSKIFISITLSFFAQIRSLHSKATFLLHQAKEKPTFGSLQNMMLVSLYTDLSHGIMSITEKFCSYLVVCSFSEERIKRGFPNAAKALTLEDVGKLHILFAETRFVAKEIYGFFLSLDSQQNKFFQQCFLEDKLLWDVFVELYKRISAAPTEFDAREHYASITELRTAIKNITGRQTALLDSMSNSVVSENDKRNTNNMLQETIEELMVAKASLSEFLHMVTDEVPVYCSIQLLLSLSMVFW